MSARDPFVVPWLAWRSLGSRRLTSGITVAVIALSVALLVGVTQIQRSAQESFSGVISQTDLIVGPRGGAMQLLLYTVFHMGAPISNTDYEDYAEIAAHPAVDWTVPISLGDSHRGYRVVATNADFYRHYRFHGDQSVSTSQGRFPEQRWDVAVGSDVARSLDYDLGDPLIVSHGLTATDFNQHKDSPFELIGILAATGTPIDRSVFVTLEGFEAMHVAPGMRDAEVQVDEITAFLVGTNSRMEALGLQREINTAEGKGMMAILPGVALSELWQVIGYVESALVAVSIFVVIVGLLGMLMTIYTSLEARRREMAILRALGSGARSIMALLGLEALLLTLSGCLLGTGLFYALQISLRPLVQRELGLFLPMSPPSSQEWWMLLIVLLAGTAMSIPPAIMAYRRSLTDGLSLQL